MILSAIRHHQTLSLTLQTCIVDWSGSVWFTCPQDQAEALLKRKMIKLELSRTRLQPQHTHMVYIPKLIHPHNTHTVHRLSDCTEASSRITVLIIISSILHSIYCYTNISSSLEEYPDFRTCQMQSRVYEDHSNCPYYCNIMFVM